MPPRSRSRTTTWRQKPSTLTTREAVVRRHLRQRPSARPRCNLNSISPPKMPSRSSATRSTYPHLKME
eukprot:1564840-Pleurochrysis_carterae.AAC.1